MDVTGKIKVTPIQNNSKHSLDTSSNADKNNSKHSLDTSSITDKNNSKHSLDTSELGSKKGTKRKSQTSDGRAKKHKADDIPEIYKYDSLPEFLRNCDSLPELLRKQILDHCKGNEMNSSVSNFNLLIIRNTLCLIT